MLVGRAREIDGIDRLLEGAAAGAGGLRIVHGEPGIGKTRLADEATARAVARGFTTAWGRAWETGGAPPYWPWIEVLQVLATPDAEVPPRLHELLDRSPSPASAERMRADPARERFELFEAVGAFLRARSRAAPLLVVLDDLHAADVPSLELLSFVARGLRSSRVAVVGTYRDLEARQPPVVDVLRRVAREGELFALRRLTQDDVAEVARQELGRLEPRVAEELFALSEGNPLFLREMLDVVATANAPSPLAALREVPVGGGVLSLVRDRLAHADPQTRTLLDVASVVGRDFSLRLVSELAGMDVGEARQRLEEAASRGLLGRRPPDRWIFAHVLVREAFYREMPAARRSAVHAQILRGLRRSGTGDAASPATLAHHAMAALPDGDAVEAVRTARVAAGLARAQLAYEEAIALLERALATCESFGVDARETCETLLALGWALTEAGQLAPGRERFRRAADLARSLRDARLLARAALGQGGEYVLAEIRAELVDVLREALDALGEAADDDDRRLRARLLARLAAALTPSATPAEPLGLARQALEMTASETDARSRIDVDVAVGAALTDFAPPDERIPVNERLLRDARTVGDRVLRLRALTRLACDHVERGDVAACDAAIAARAALAEAIGHPRYLWQSPLLRSMRAMPDGRFEDCEAEIAEARRLAEDALDPNAERCIELHRLFVLIVAGRTAVLEAHEATALRVLDPLPHAATLRAWASAVMASQLGQQARALHSLRCLGTSSYMTARMGRVSIAEAAVIAGATDLYAPLYASFSPEEDANACWGPFAFTCSPPIARVMGILAFAMGRVEEGRHHCERALSLTDRTEAPAHRAWALLALGEGLSAAGTGREHLLRARDLAEKLQMRAVAERATAALDRTRQASASPPVPPRTAAPAFSFRRADGEWSVEHAGRVHRVKDVRGMSMLSMLIDAPGREIHVLDLASSAPGDPGVGIDAGDAGEWIDAKARDAYKRRISDLRSEVEEAERYADLGRAARLRGELEALTEQITAATGLGGRERRVGSAAERARIVVQRRIREAIKRIAVHDPDLGRHFDWTVRTGTFCAYEPDGRGPGR